MAVEVHWVLELVQQAVLAVAVLMVELVELVQADKVMLVVLVQVLLVMPQAVVEAVLELLDKMPFYRQLLVVLVV